MRASTANTLHYRSAASAYLTVILAFLTLLQFGGLYVLTPQDMAVCLDKDVSDALGAGAGASHHHDEASAIPLGNSKGAYFQHCKDTSPGMGTASQPMAPASTGIETQKSESWVRAVPGSLSLIQHFLPPPFQPPRA
jgi:hypothetical protein